MSFNEKDSEPIDKFIHIIERKIDILTSLRNEFKMTSLKFSEHLESQYEDFLRMTLLLRDQIKREKRDYKIEKIDYLNNCFDQEKE